MSDLTKTLRKLEECRFRLHDVHMAAEQAENQIVTLMRHEKELHTTKDQLLLELAAAPTASLAEAQERLSSVISLFIGKNHEPLIHALLFSASNVVDHLKAASKNG